MEIIKLKDYKEEMVCAVSRFKDVEYLCTDEIEKIKGFKENGYTIHGTINKKRLVTGNN